MLEDGRQRMIVIHFRDKRMRADLRIVSLRRADGMDRLNGNSAGEEELGRERVRGGDVWRKSVTLVEPEGLAELANDIAILAQRLQDEFPNIDDIVTQLG